MKRNQIVLVAGRNPRLDENALRILHQMEENSKRRQRILDQKKSRQANDGQ